MPTSVFSLPTVNGTDDIPPVVRRVLREVASSGTSATIAFDDLVSRVFARLPPDCSRREELVDAAVMEEARHISTRRVSGNLMVSLTPAGIQFYNELVVMDDDAARGCSKKEAAIQEYLRVAQQILPVMEILRTWSPLDARLIGVERLDEVLRDHYEASVYMQESNNTLLERFGEVSEEVRQLEIQAQLTTSDLEDD